MRGSLVIFLMIFAFKRTMAEETGCDNRVDVLPTVDFPPELSAIFSDRFSVKEPIDCALICYMKKCDVTYFDSTTNMCQFTENTASSSQNLSCPLLEAFQQPALNGENVDDVKRFCVRCRGSTATVNTGIADQLAEAKKKESSIQSVTIRVPPRSPPRILIQPPKIIHTNNDQLVNDLVSGPNTQSISPHSYQFHQEDPPRVKPKKKWPGPPPNTSIFRPRPPASFQTSSELFGRHRPFEKFNRLPIIPAATIENRVSTIQSQIRPSIPSLPTHPTTLKVQMPALPWSWDQKPKNSKGQMSSKDDINPNQKSEESRSKGQNSGEFPVPSPIFREVTIPWNGISRKVSESFEEMSKERIILHSTSSPFTIEMHRITIPWEKKEHISSLPLPIARPESTIITTETSDGDRSLTNFLETTGESREKLSLVESGIGSNQWPQSTQNIMTEASTQPRLTRGQGGMNKGQFGKVKRIRIWRPSRPGLWRIGRPKMKKTPSISSRLVIRPPSPSPPSEMESFKPPPLPPLPNNESAPKRRIAIGNFRRRLKRPCYRNREPHCGSKWRNEGRKAVERNTFIDPSVVEGVEKKKSKGTGIARMKRSQPSTFARLSSS